MMKTISLCKIRPRIVAMEMCDRNNNGVLVNSKMVSGDSLGKVHEVWVITVSEIELELPS